MDVSVIFATCNRDTILKNTLDSLINLNTDQLEWELIVIDNAVKDQTKSLVESYIPELPVKYITESTPGKNNALNKALPLAKGALLVFTDDDIIAQPDWLNELYIGAKRNPKFDIFGGSIRPHYPNVKLDKRINLSHHSISSALVITDPTLTEGPIRPGRIWGPNMAIRRKVIDEGFIFNSQIGPNGKDYIMGSETEFLLRVNKAGHESVFLPNAVVLHQIREDQLNLEWMAGRAFRQGKGNIALFNTVKSRQLWGAPRYLYKKAIIHKLLMYIARLKNDDKQFFSHFIRYYFLKGQIHQCRRSPSSSST